MQGNTKSVDLKNKGTSVLGTLGGNTFTELREGPWNVWRSANTVSGVGRGATRWQKKGRHVYSDSSEFTKVRGKKGPKVETTKKKKKLKGKEEKLPLRPPRTGDDWAPKKAGVSENVA